MERVAERLPRFKLQRAEATEPVAITQLCIDPSAKRGAIGFYAGSRILPELRTFRNNDCITVGTIGAIMGTVGTERADCGCNSTIGLGAWLGRLRDLYPRESGRCDRGAFARCERGQAERRAPAAVAWQVALRVLLPHPYIAGACAGGLGGEGGDEGGQGHLSALLPGAGLSPPARIGGGAMTSTLRLGVQRLGEAIRPVGCRVPEGPP